MSPGSPGTMLPHVPLFPDPRSRGAIWRRADREETLKFARNVVSCPRLNGPSTVLVWTMKEKQNAMEEAQAGGDHRQAA